MDAVEKLDRRRPMHIYGSVTRDLSKMPGDPLHEIAMDLAQAQLTPAFLRLGDPIEEASIEVSAGQFLAWLDTQPKWANAFYADMQSLAQTAGGEPLQTTWLQSEQFWSMLNDGRGTPIIDEIQLRVRAWEALGLDEILFDAFVVGPNSESAKLETVAVPVAA